MLDPRALLGLLKAGILNDIQPQPSMLNVLAMAPFRARNLASSLRIHSSIRPNAVALVDDSGPYTWAELQEETLRTARLLERHGPAGSRLIVAMRNSRELVTLLVAASRAGWVSIPLNTWSGEGEVAHIVANQEPRLIVAHEEFAGTLRAAAPKTPLYSCGPGGAGSWGARVQQESAKELLTPGGGRIVIHTSGTTGRPKGAERDIEGSGLATLGELLERVPLKQSDKFYVAPPLFHTLAFGMMSVSLVMGSTLYLSRRFDHTDLIPWLEREQITAMAAVPVMVQRALDATPTAGAPDLRVLMTSGAATTTALRQRIRERFGLVHYDLYGATEAGWATIARPEEIAQRPLTVGKPGKRMAVHIVDSALRPCPTGTVGDVWIDSGWSFQGYTNIDSSEDAPQGWINVGDRGYIDADGFLFISGRKDDMVIIGGENVYPSEVEDILDTHPSIADCAVVGVPHEDLGQALVAFVVPKPGHQPGEVDIQRYIIERLAKYKAPREVRFMDELPRNATGKVLRRALIADFMERAD